MFRVAMVDFGNVVGIFDTPRWYEFITNNKVGCREPYELFCGFLADIIKDYDLGRLTDLAFYSKVRLAYQMNTTEKEFFDEMGDIISIDYEMLDVVRSLRKRGIVTVLVSNLNPFHDRFLLERHPEVFAAFDFLMISSREHVAKPDPESLKRPLSWIPGLKPEECIFIDDSRTNIEVACGLGIKGWHYNVTDDRWCMNGKLDKERQKFKNFLALLDKQGLLYDQNKSR